MKSLKILSSLLIFLSLNGCIKEDMSECPLAYNAQIEFTYTGDTNDHAMFAKMIHHVTLYVFDKESGALVITQKLDQTELKQFQGAKLSLEPGTYNIVCWGNANSDTHVVANTYNTATLSSTNYANSQKLTTESHLYFGEHDLAVNSFTQLENEKIPFRSSHINLEIYVKGLGQQVQVEVSNLAAQYDFKMNPTTPFNMIYYPTETFDSEKNAVAALLQTLRFPNDNTTEVKVFDDKNQLRHTVNLKEYLIENNIQVEGTHESTVSMLIEFTDMGVSITIPEWATNPVDPEK